MTIKEYVHFLYEGHKEKQTKASYCPLQKKV